MQYGFTPDERHYLFGDEDWGNFIVEDFDGVWELLEDEQGSSDSLSLMTIVSKPLDNREKDGPSPEILPDRFNSVINFSNFLLHVLRVVTEEDVALDDKQLLSEFDEHLFRKKSPVKAVKEFAFALLKCKYLFDQFVLKREYSQGKDAWSLKKMKWYKQGRKRFSVSFINSFDENEDGYEGVNRQILMLLSAFHVSTPTLVYKHWLNAALYFLYCEESIEPNEYLNYMTNVARRFVFERFLCVGDSADYYSMIYDQTDEQFPKNRKLPHIDLNKLCFNQIENNFVFNYLDYLLWIKGRESDPVVKEFEFTFRSSVEHFYPQHPMEGHPPLDNDHLHKFGNLCLISHSKNSRLSNLPPEAKKAHFSAGIAEKVVDSLKLLEMIKILNDSDAWGESEILEHGDAMIDLLLSSTVKS